MQGRPSCLVQRCIPEAGRRHGRVTANQANQANQKHAIMVPLPLDKQTVGQRIAEELVGVILMTGAPNDR